MQLPQPQPPLLVLLLLLATVVSSSPLDPKQLKLVHSLNIKDPCNNHNSSSITITCDAASPYRHITSISFTNCPLSPPHHLPISLHSFTAVSFFLHHRRQLSGLFLARLKNLEISSTPISTSNHLYVILGNMPSNRISGTIPNSLSSISQLTHLDLSMNQLNGTVPMFFSEMKNLRHLDLSDNSFHGVLPFNESFIKNLEVFEIGGNSDLCFNDSVISSRLKLGIAPCDKYGLVKKEDYGDYEGEGENEKKEKKEEEHNGSRTIWFGIGIVLFSIVLFYHLLL